MNIAVGCSSHRCHAMPRLAFDTTFRVSCNVHIRCNFWVQFVICLIVWCLIQSYISPRTIVRHPYDATADKDMRTICYHDPKFCNFYLDCDSDAQCELHLLKHGLLSVQNIYAEKSTHDAMMNSREYAGDRNEWYEDMQVLLELEHAAKRVLSYYSVY